MGCGSCSSGGGCGAGCGGNGGCGSSTGRAGTSACPAMHVFDWLTDLGVAGAPLLYDLVEVVFKAGRKGFYRNNRELDLHTGDYVIVEADRGVDMGTVNMSGEMVRLRVRSKGIDENGDFPNVVRIAGLADVERLEQNREREAESFHVGRQSIDRLNLPMKLVDVEWQFDLSKVTFFFTADHRVDFRQLVRDLASRFRTRVELRQIGARDEAGRIGGIGSCGRELCCSTWLQEFKPVSTQAAKIQNLPLNPVRLSGQCGRLKCCLNYELEQYMTALKHFPPVDARVETSEGTAIVQKLDIFRDIVWLQYPNGFLEEKPLDEVRDLLGAEAGEPLREIRPPTGGGKGKRRP